MQRKLAIGADDNLLEQEADRIADRVMRLPDPAPIGATTAAGNNLQRKCTCGSSASSCECEDRKKKHEGTLQRLATQAVPPVGMAPPIVHEVLGCPGQPLDDRTRAFFEPRLGLELRAVRTHTDSRASQSAQAVNALAYTIGRDIVFRQGQYSPETSRGRLLLAHELAHVVQQAQINRAVINRKECSASRSCSPPDHCDQPDTGEEGTPAPSTWWNLTVNIDIERSSFESALRAGKLGHTNVRFSEGNGKQFTYGFYPAGAVPNENVRGVDGCINHPDTSHDDCIDTTVQYPLKKEQYDAALTFAQNFCRAHHYYGLNSANVSYTCTTFASEVTKAAGKQLPSSASAPTEVYYQKVPPIDNPNTLNENVPSLPQSIGSTEEQILSIAEIWGPRMLERFPWQEKARWINILLDQTWINERDVAAIEKLCTSGMSSTDLPKLKKAVSPSLNNMNSSSQRKRVEKALGS